MREAGRREGKEGREEEEWEAGRREGKGGRVAHLVLILQNECVPIHQRLQAWLRASGPNVENLLTLSIQLRSNSEGQMCMHVHVHVHVYNRRKQGKVIHVNTCA